MWTTAALGFHFPANASPNSGERKFAMKREMRKKKVAETSLKGGVGIIDIGMKMNVIR